MSFSNFNTFVANCQPHGVFNNNWATYSPSSFSQTFLPNITAQHHPILGENDKVIVVDGVKLFEYFNKTNNEALNILNNDSELNIYVYAYPEGVPAADKKALLSPGANDVCMFFELAEDGSITIELRFGQLFQLFLKEYFEGLGQNISIQALEEKKYKSDKGDLKSLLLYDLSHKNFLLLGFQLIGVRVEDVNFKIDKLSWLDKDGNSIKFDAVLGTHNIHFGEQVQLVIKGKQLPPMMKVTIGHQNDKRTVFMDGNKDYEFVLYPQKGETKTPLFVIPLKWYDETVEQYDSKNVKTINDPNRIKRITARISKVKQQLLGQKDQIIPMAYRRNHEEFLGLLKTTGQNKNVLSATDNYENLFIEKNTDIKKLVADFENFIIQNTTIDLSKSSSDATRFKKELKRFGEKLWELAVKQFQAGYSDDRPLYWARNRMQVLLKRLPAFKTTLDYSTSMPKSSSMIKGKKTIPYECIEILQKTSRNYTGIDFSEAYKHNLKKILIVCFDPYSLDKANGGSHNVYNSNTSGLCGLKFHNSQIIVNQNKKGFIQSMIVPIRYTDFDGNPSKDKRTGKGIIENYVGPWITKVDMIASLSQDIVNYSNLDMIATKKRGGGKDNLDFERPLLSDSIPTTDNWIQTSLPDEMADGVEVRENWLCYRYNLGLKNGKLHPISRTLIANKSNPPSPSLIIDEGPGGNYLSNELFYRIAKLREDSKRNFPTGHIHTRKFSPALTLNTTEVSNVQNEIRDALMRGIDKI